MGASASAPRQADAPAKPLHAAAPKLASSTAALGSTASSSESSSDDDSGVAANGGVVKAAAAAAPIEPPPLDHPSPEALARMCSAVATLIEGVGEDSGREGLFDTPKRVAKAWIDATSGYRQTVTSTVGGALFTEPSLAPPDDAPLSSGGVVLVRDVEFASTSSRDLLPFYGKLHIAYVPRGGVVLGLSKVARLAKLFSRRLTTQRELTRDLLAALDAEVRPAGACVLVEATHLAHGPAARRAVTTACSGVFLASGNASKSNASSSGDGPDVEEFLDLLRLSGVDPLAGGWEESLDNGETALSALLTPPPTSPKGQQQQQHQQRAKAGRPSARPSSPGEVVVAGCSSKSSSSSSSRAEEEHGEEAANGASPSPSSVSSSAASSPPARPVTPGLESSSSSEGRGGEAAATAARAPSAKEAAAAVASVATVAEPSPPAPPPSSAEAPATPGGAVAVEPSATTTTKAGTATNAANGVLRVPPSCSSSVVGEDGSESDFGGERCLSASASASASAAAAAPAAVGTPRALAQSTGSFSFVHGGEIAAANRSRRGYNDGSGNGDGSSDDGGDAAAAAASLLHLPVSPAAAAKRSPPLAPGTRQAMEDAVRALLAEVVGGAGAGGGGGAQTARNNRRRSDASASASAGAAAAAAAAAAASATAAAARLAALEGAPRRYVEFLLASTAGYGAAPAPATPAPGTFATKLKLKPQPQQPRPREAPCGCGGERLFSSPSASSSVPGSPRTTAPSLLPFATPDRPTFDPATPDFEASLRFTSQCEHHMLPFHGVARLAVVGACRSKKKPGGPLLLPSLREVEAMVAAFSHRLQVQERLTQQLADGLVAACSEEEVEEEGEEGEGAEGAEGGEGKRKTSRGPAGVLVLCEAAHLCMVSRGVEKHASSTVTLAGRGVLASGARERRELVRRLAALEAGVV